MLTVAHSVVDAGATGGDDRVRRKSMTARRRQEAPSTRNGMTLGGAACASWWSAVTIFSAGNGRLKW
jgi:hypothetical protein